MRKNSLSKRRRFKDSWDKSQARNDVFQYFKPSAQVQLVRPAGETHETTVRILPGINPDDPEQFDPWRLSLEEEDWGYWIVSYPTIDFIGEAEQVCFIISDPYSYDSAERPSPVLALRRAAQNMLRDLGRRAPGWLIAMLRGAGGQDAKPTLPKPKVTSFMQCFVMQAKGNIYKPPLGFPAKSPTPVLALTKTATEAMFRAMNTPNPKYKGPLDIERVKEIFYYGDPIDIDSGCFATFVREGTPCRQAEDAPVVDEDEDENGVGIWSDSKSGSSGDEVSFRGYDCYLHRYFVDDRGKRNSPVLTEYRDLVKSKVKPWNEVIHVPDDREQVEILCRVFRNRASFLVSALEDFYEEYLPEYIKKSAASSRRRSRASVPAQEEDFDGADEEPEVDESVVPDEDVWDEESPF